MHKSWLNSMASEHLLDFFKASCPYHNIALNQPTYQSSTNYGGVSSRAVDGNRDPAWDHHSCIHSGWANDPFWIVDLRRVFRISHVTITNRDACMYIPQTRNNAHMDLLSNTWNCGLCMHREYWEHFPRQRGLAITTCITARASRTCRDACRHR